MLTKNKTLLRHPISSDKDILLKLRNDIDLQAMLMSRAKANNPFKLDSWLNQKMSNEDTIFFIIADSIENFPVGYTQLVNLDLINRKCNLGICIAQEYQGKGYAVDTFNLLENYSKEIFNIHKIVLSVLTSNTRAIKFYEKMLYRQVGVLELDFYIFNKFHDVLIMEKII